MVDGRIIYESTGLKVKMAALIAACRPTNFPDLVTRNHLVPDFHPYRTMPQMPIHDTYTELIFDDDEIAGVGSVIIVKPPLVSARKVGISVHRHEDAPGSHCDNRRSGGGGDIYSILIAKSLEMSPATIGARQLRDDTSPQDRVDSIDAHRETPAVHGHIDTNETNPRAADVADGFRLVLGGGCMETYNISDFQLRERQTELCHPDKCVNSAGMPKSQGHLLIAVILTYEPQLDPRLHRLWVCPSCTSPYGALRMRPRHQCQNTRDV